MTTTERYPALPFGIQDGNEVELMEFYPDIDGLLWYRATDETVSLDGLSEISRQRRENAGRCIDTAEYISRIGEMLFELLQSPPEDSTLATFTSEGWCRTRTFGETLDVTFHGQGTETV